MALKTRGPRAVCCCYSHGCSKYYFKNSQGERQQGVELAVHIKKRHRIADALNLKLKTIESYSSDQNSNSESSVKILTADNTHGPDQPSNHHPIQHPTIEDGPLERKDVYECGMCQLFLMAHAVEITILIIERVPGHFHQNLLSRTHPAILQSCLFAGIFHVLEHCSVTTSSFILRSQLNLLRIALSNGILHQKPRSLSASEELSLEQVPRDIRTVIKWLQIDPSLVLFLCCSQCFAIYPNEDKAPDLCNYSYIRNENRVHKKNLDIGLSVCGQPLFKITKSPRRIPVRYYATQDLFHWIARLFSRPGIEESLNLSALRARKPYNPSDVHDIQDSRVWKQFSAPSTQQFTSHSNNLVFGMFTDAINPYGNRQAGKHVSVTFIVLVCLSLPIAIRYSPENIFLVGIAPGPKEPSVDLFNWILIPIVEQLRTLWRTVLYLSQTYQNGCGRRVYAALLPFFADLPALRRSLGFSSAVATRMCSYCLLERQAINNLDPTSWPKRTLEEHKLRATEYHHLKTKKTREKHLLLHGTRYSALLKLDYWNIIDYHVVDSMHNLLLGLLQWHCRKFWGMSESDSSQPQPQNVHPSEVVALVKEANNYLTTKEDLHHHPGHSNSGVNILNAQFDSETDPTDFVFDPTTDNDGWNGHWTQSSEEIIFDSQALDFINKMLPRIHIPTWIKRAVPALGKASFGRLKADEWRNLFTIQLPLVLPIFWIDSLPDTRSLLHNFAHLVSLVNLALKRSTSTDRITRYRHHITSYLQSCLIIFEGVQLAPNHHMAMHLADCLEKFGPTRAYWSFPMERLMAQVLKASDNNRPGELEVTFMRKFCQAGNLKSLLDNLDLPPSIDPFIKELQSYYNPIPFKPSINVRKFENSLDSNLYEGLISKLNHKFSIKEIEWVSSSEYSTRKVYQLSQYAPVPSRATFLKNYSIDEVVYSTNAENENNSMVALKDNSKAAYGVIDSIFKHSRVLPDGKTLADVFFSIKTLLPIPPGAMKNPFQQFSSYEMPVSLRFFNPRGRCVVFHESEILSHCAWMELNAGEVSVTDEIKFKTIALVSLDRS